MNFLADALRIHRRRERVSAAELSRRIGMSASYVAKVEAGSLDPSVRTFAKMATELNLTDMEIAWLVRLIAAQEELNEGGEG